MRSDALHVAPADPRSRRRRTRVILASAVTAVLAASGFYIATADAAETSVPGRLQAEAWSAEHGARTEKTSDQDGGRNVGWLKAADWMRYDNVQIGTTVTARSPPTTRPAAPSSCASAVQPAG